jgi:hypothetical protein
MPICWAGTNLNNGSRNNDHPVPGETGSHTQIEATIERRERLVKAFKLLKGGRMKEHTRFADCQHVTQAVILGLVKLSFGKRHSLSKT